MNSIRSSPKWHDLSSLQTINSYWEICYVPDPMDKFLVSHFETQKWTRLACLVLHLFFCPFSLFVSLSLSPSKTEPLSFLSLSASSPESPSQSFAPQCVLKSHLRCFHHEPITDCSVKDIFSYKTHFRHQWAHRSHIWHLEDQGGGISVLKWNHMGSYLPIRLALDMTHVMGI